MLPTSSGAGISTAAAIATVRAIFIIRSSFYRQTTGTNVKKFRASSSITSRWIIQAALFGRVILLLKFSEKISEPGGHGSFKGVLCTEALPDCVLNIAR